MPATLVPMHYDGFEIDPWYLPVADRWSASGRDRGALLRGVAFSRPGESFEPAAVAVGRLTQPVLSAGVGFDGVEKLRDLLFRGAAEADLAMPTRRRRLLVAPSTTFVALVISIRPPGRLMVLCFELRVDRDAG